MRVISVKLFNLLLILRSGFSGPEHRVLLKKALRVLASRLKEEEKDLTLDQLSRCDQLSYSMCAFCQWRGWSVTSVFGVYILRHAFQYLQNFRSSLPSLNTALCLIQLLIVLTQFGGSNHRAYREQICEFDLHYCILHIELHYTVTMKLSRHLNVH